MKVAFLQIRKILLLLLINTTAFGQMTIDWPIERTVFQRNNSNLGNINISGNVTAECDRIEARLLARGSNQGVTTSWVTIDSSVEGLAFTGKIQNTGGWYRLEVRAIRGEDVVFSKAIERVGIGEVFVIAGQSNAQGYGASPNANGAVDDRVNAYGVDYFKVSEDHSYKSLPDYLNNFNFTKLERSSNIGPGGYTPWCYGELGDLLVRRLNVPVMFFNAGYTGTSSTNWRASAEGNQAYFQYTNEPLDSGSPYKALRVTLQSVNTLLGVRSILWHQGEFDSEINLSPAQYYNNLDYVINKTRTDINANIPWVVARVSRYFGKINANIISAQNLIISNKSAVWAGPETDNIQPNRYDGGHFQNIPGSLGLTQLANTWNDYLTDSFFSSSVPILSRDILEIRHYCVSQGTVRLNLDSQYSDYFWSNANKNSSLTVSTGTYRVDVKDNAGNVLYSNRLNVQSVYPQNPPVIEAPEGLVGCEGKVVPLRVTPSKYTVHWNSGDIGNNLEVSNAAGYAVTYRSNQNCYSSSSAYAEVTFKSPPLKPNLMFINGDGNQCEGQNITVAINNVQGASILWSTGSTSNQIVLNNDLGQDLTATLYSLPNCPSPSSDVVNYKFYPAPTTPAIELSGPFYIKAGNANIESKYDWLLNGNSVNGITDQYLHLTEAGIYRVKAFNEYTTSSGSSIKCGSDLSDEFSVMESETFATFSVFPNPVSTGTIQVSSDGERENVNVYIIDELGREIYKTAFDKLSYPRILDLSSYQLAGKYFVLLKYQSQSKAFPVVFVK